MEMYSAVRNQRGRTEDIKESARARARGYKTFFMLNSIEHEIFPAHKC